MAAELLDAHCSLLTDCSLVSSNKMSVAVSMLCPALIEGRVIWLYLHIKQSVWLRLLFILT